MRAFRIAAALGVGLCFAAPAAYAAEDGEQTYQGTDYVCTGFGQETRNDPRWNGYPLKLVFATKSGAYFADVVTTIENAAGETVLRTDCNAPWVLVELPPGQYQVTARAQPANVERSTTVQVQSDRQTERILHFPEVTG